MTASFVVEPLSARHDRAAFACGVEPLDRYLREQAGQDVKRRVANCFVAGSGGSHVVSGYYTLAAASIPVTEIPSELSRRLPRYPLLPAALIGRLAVDLRYARRSLGSALLYDAIARAMRADTAVYAIVVDAKDETAATFYARFGFRRFASRPLGLFLPVATAAKLSGS